MTQKDLPFIALSEAESSTTRCFEIDVCTTNAKPLCKLDRCRHGERRVAFLVHYIS